jgi:hypothetical protein
MWSGKITEEFYLQGDLETRLGTVKLGRIRNGSSSTLSSTLRVLLCSAAHRRHAASERTRPFVRVIRFSL